MGNKQKTKFIKIQKELYKRLSNLELEMKDPRLRKKITTLVDKVYNLKPATSDEAFTLSDELLLYSKELQKEMMNPITQIINNYIEKIDSLLNQIKYESEV